MKYLLVNQPNPRRHMFELKITQSVLYCGAASSGNARYRNNRSEGWLIVVIYSARLFLFEKMQHSIQMVVRACVRACATSILFTEEQYILRNNFNSSKYTRLEVKHAWSTVVPNSRATNRRFKRDVHPFLRVVLNWCLHCKKRCAF